MHDARRLSPRQRRLRSTVILVATGSVAAAVAAGVAYWKTRTATYRPGEDHAEITKRLDRHLPPDAPEPRFADVADEAGLGAYVAFAGARSSQLPEDMGAGVAWGDFDGDGDEDLFAASAGGSLTAPRDTWAPSLLFENRGDGTFAVSRALPELRIVGMGAAWADFDGDGREDLVVSGWNALHLFRNVGGRLVPSDLLAAPPGFWAGVSWADYDRDGDPDLYVCGYVRYQAPEGGERRVSQQYGNAVPYTLNPASYEPERNLLFRNDGVRGFTEVAQQLGVDNPEGRSLGGLWHDFDDDGWPDLYVANDISDNALYLNEGGRFRDASHGAWVADYRGAMGLAAGDWNRDGDDDLFVTHWVAQENALYDSLLVDMAGGASRDPRPGETASRERIQFGDNGTLVGLGQPALRYVGWGAEFADLDADGWLDLPVSNGSTFETKDVPARLVPQPPFLFWNRRGEFFHDLAPSHPSLAQPREGRGLAVADYDRDGDLDVVLVDRRSGLVLLRNDMPQGHWLQVRLKRRAGTTEGARLVAHVGDMVLRRTLSGVSYLSQSTRVAHFGLGEHTRVDRLEVRFADGEVQTWRDLEAGSLWTLAEGESEPRRERALSEAERRQRIAEFWRLHRDGMRLLKQEGDTHAAEERFRAALELDPEHEDARYYLASVLETHGEPEAAIAELRVLAGQNPHSHRAFKQLGSLLARTAQDDARLEEARRALERALEINLEETGSLLVLGEVDLLLGRRDDARRHLELACRTNPRAVGGFFLRGYLAWTAGDREAATTLLRAAHEARGPEWKPEGSVAEGDVRSRQHREVTPLSRFWQHWNGAPDPKAAFGELHARLAHPPSS